MWLPLLSLSVGFVFGAVAILAAEALLVYIIVNRLQHRTKKLQDREKEAAIRTTTQQIESKSERQSLQLKQGVVWVLEPEKVPKSWQQDKLVRGEQKRKKEFYEVSPIKKYAKIQNQLLSLSESDGSQTVIQLKGCSIEAVSSTSLASRKWAKRFPIKLENKASIIYKGSKVLYVYLETSWEKESWCKALRSASCDDKEKLNRVAKLRAEFHCYLTLLNDGYPSFMKYTGGLSVAEPADRTNRADGSSSKVRMFLRKITKKYTKVGPDNKLSWTSSLGREERKIRPSQDSVSATNMGDGSPPVKRAQSFTEGNLAIPPSSTLSHSGSQSHISVISDVNSDEKFSSDEGTLCLNLLMSRLFFDAKSSVEIKRSIQAQIQRSLSNMRIPSYIGEVVCTDFNLGNLPPYIHGMRVVPMDMSDVWALEVDVGYYGGAVVDVETRLEVRELDLPKGIGDAGSESGSVGDVSTDLFEEVEYFGKQLNLAEAVDAVEQREECEPKPDGSNSSRSSMSASNNGSRWKSLLNSIAKQVSQVTDTCHMFQNGRPSTSISLTGACYTKLRMNHVPLSLAIRITSLRGTLRLHIKPPPSDQLWFSFTSMPDIDFNLDSSVGDRKITSGRIALFLISRFKAAIREMLVLPNFESVCIPWMVAEKDDWVQRKHAPFIWINQESADDSPTTVCEIPIFQPIEEKYTTEASGEGSSDYSLGKHQKFKKAEFSDKPIPESSSNVFAFSPSSKDLSAGSSQELKSPLLANGELQLTCRNNLDDILECQTPSRSTGSGSFNKHSSHTSEEEDSKPKRMGRRSRMIDLGKKLEEKRRTIEEKGRNMVEKMRGP